jgi:predicted GNAT superfamily acetyltransferase
MQRIVELEIQVWGIHPRDSFPAHMLCLAHHHGGAVLIAEADNQLIGFSIGFPARRGDEIVLWSYITGVHPDWQGKGVGSTLKRTQRKWAGARGYNYIVWSFDPLQAGNANLNLNRLKAVARVYHENLYGVMNDEINRGMRSDRLEAWWKVHNHDRFDASNTQPVFLVADQDGTPVSPATFPSDTFQPLAIAIPRSRNVDRHAWQQSVRRAFRHAFLLGYEAHQFVRTDATNYYLLSRQKVNG